MQCYEPLDQIMLRVPSGQLEPYLLGIIDVDKEQCLSF